MEKISENILVSIIMPTFNSSTYIAESIQSVINQTYLNWELIIVNDASTDDTLKIIEKFRLIDKRINVLTNTSNKGVAESRNRGIAISKGEYIAFLDSDDIWLETKIEKQLQYMETKKIWFSYTAYDVINSDGKYIKSISIPKYLDYKKALKGNDIGCLTVMINKKNINNIHMPSIKHEDYAAWLSILKKGIIAYGIPETLSKYRKTNNSVSSNKIKSMCWVWNIYRNYEYLNFIMSLYYMVFYISKGFYKHVFIKS